MSILGRSSLLVPHGHSAVCACSNILLACNLPLQCVPHPSVHNPICPGVKFMKIAGNSVDCLMGGAVRASSCHGNEMTLGHEFNLGCELTASFPSRFPWSLSLGEEPAAYFLFSLLRERRFSWKDLLALRGAERKDEGPSFRSTFHFFLQTGAADPLNARERLRGLNWQLGKQRTN